MASNSSVRVLIQFRGKRYVYQVPTVDGTISLTELKDFIREKETFPIREILGDGYTFEKLSVAFNEYVDLASSCAEIRDLDRIRVTIGGTHPMALRGSGPSYVVDRGPSAITTTGSPVAGPSGDSQQSGPKGIGAKPKECKTPIFAKRKNRLHDTDSSLESTTDDDDEEQLSLAKIASPGNDLSTDSDDDEYDPSATEEEDTLDNDYGMVEEYSSGSTDSSDEDESVDIEAAAPAPQPGAAADTDDASNGPYFFYVKDDLHVSK